MADSKDTEMSEQRDFRRKWWATEHLKAQNLYAGPDGHEQMLAILDAYLATEKKIGGETDWYGVFGLSAEADFDAIKMQYLKMWRLLHPDNNKLMGADGAFYILSEAWNLLSDDLRKEIYDWSRNKSTSGSSLMAQPLTETEKEKVAYDITFSGKRIASDGVRAATKSALVVLRKHPAVHEVQDLLAILDFYLSAGKEKDGKYDWYAILRVNAGADNEKIKEQYEDMALTLDPKKNKSGLAGKAFQLLQQAYNCLSDESKRDDYNRSASSLFITKCTMCQKQTRIRRIYHKCRIHCSISSCYKLFTAVESRDLPPVDDANALPPVDHAGIPIFFKKDNPTFKVGAPKRVIKKNRGCSGEQTDAEMMMDDIHIRADLADIARMFPDGIPDRFQKRRRISKTGDKNVGFETTEMNELIDTKTETTLRKPKTIRKHKTAVIDKKT